MKFFSLILFFTSVVFASSTPIVYTGSFKNRVTGKQQIARLVMTASFKPSQKNPSLTGTLTLFFGNDNSREYIGLHYDPVVIIPDSKELFFSRDDDGRARRLPTVRLKFNQDSTEAQGTLYSHSEGTTGDLKLKLGWESDVTTPLRELGGIYDADCGPSDGSHLVLRDIEIVPSRIFADKTFPEAALGEINYIGNGTCHRNYGFVSCVNLNPGNYNFYNGKVLFHQGSWLWNCERDGDDALNCSSPRYRHCRLERARKLPMLEYQPVNRPQPRPIPWVDFEAPDSKGKCSDWEKDLSGQVTHILGGRKQPVEIKLVSLPMGKSPDKCLLSGTAIIYFQEHEKISNRITFPIVNTEILASEKHIVLQSDVYTDLTLEIYRETETSWKGNWVSRLYGLVGPFEVNHSSKVTPVPEMISVQGVSGEFVWGEKKNWQLSISSIEAGLDKSSHDPYVQLKIIGSLIMQGDFSDRIHPFRVGSMGGSSYDYFTNTLVIRAGSIWSGYIEPKGLSLRGVSSGYLNYAPDRALWVPRYFDRVF